MALQALQPLIGYMPMGEQRTYDDLHCLRMQLARSASFYIRHEYAADAAQEILLKVVTHLSGVHDLGLPSRPQPTFLTAIKRSKELPELSLDGMGDRPQRARKGGCGAARTSVPAKVAFENPMF